jgi:hypothetical protein
MSMVKNLKSNGTAPELPAHAGEGVDSLECLRRHLKGGSIALALYRQWVNSPRMGISPRFPQIRLASKYGDDKDVIPPSLE